MEVMFDHVCDSYPGLDHVWHQVFIENIKTQGSEQLQLHTGQLLKIKAEIDHSASSGSL